MCPFRFTWSGGRGFWPRSLWAEPGRRGTIPVLSWAEPSRVPRLSIRNSLVSESNPRRLGDPGHMVAVVPERAVLLAPGGRVFRPAQRFQGAVLVEQVDQRGDTARV